jgi:hypothetical protein
MDTYSGGSYRKKYVPPMSKAEIRRKKKKLEAISKKAKNHHENIDIPGAEEFLKQSFSSKKRVEKKIKIKTTNKNKTFFSIIKNYIYGFFK